MVAGETTSSSRAELREAEGLVSEGGVREREAKREGGGGEDGHRLKIRGVRGKRWETGDMDRDKDEGQWQGRGVRGEGSSFPFEC